MFKVSDAPFNPCMKFDCFFLSLIKSGLFQIGVKEDIAKVEFVTLKNFHQAVRVEAIVIALEHG